MALVNREEIAVVTHVGDTSKPWGFELRRPITEEPVNLTGANATFYAVDSTGAPVITPTAMTITGAVNGELQYQPTSTDVATARVIYGYIEVTTSGATETFPPDGRRLAIHIYGD